jgi:hypothetical protein
LDNQPRETNWQSALDEIKNQFVAFLANMENYFKSSCNGVHWKHEGFDSTTEKNSSVDPNHGNRFFDTQHLKETDSTSIKHPSGLGSRIFSSINTSLSQKLNASVEQHVSTLSDGEDDFTMEMVESNAGVINASSVASIEEIGMNEVATIKYYNLLILEII